MNKNLRYKIFEGEDSDWIVAAKHEKGSKENPIVLYEGDNPVDAYISILKDMADISTEERDMEESGTYIPKKEDFE